MYLSIYLSKGSIRAASSLRRSLTRFRYAASERIDTAAADDGIAVNETCSAEMDDNKMIRN